MHWLIIMHWGRFTLVEPCPFLPYLLPRQLLMPARPVAEPFACSHSIPAFLEALPSPVKTTFSNASEAQLFFPS